MVKSTYSFGLDSDSDDTLAPSVFSTVTSPPPSNLSMDREPFNASRLLSLSDSESDEDEVKVIAPVYGYSRPKFDDFFDMAGEKALFKGSAVESMTASAKSSIGTNASGRKTYAGGYKREAMDFEVRRAVPDFRPTVLPRNINLSADVEWKKNWKLLPYMPGQTPGHDHFHFGGVAAVYRYPPDKPPKIEPGVVRFQMPKPTNGKADFNPTNPSVIRGTHESLRLQCLIYLREHWDGVADLDGPGCEIDVKILRDYCPEVVFLISQQGINKDGDGQGGTIDKVHVDFNAGHPEVAKLIAERIVFKYKGRKLTFAASNLQADDTPLRIH